MQGYEREFDSWHTIEHMPERLGVPGFPRGRRYIATQRSEHAMFILYEGAHIETFRSPGLIARLNDPTEWTKRVQPGLVNFIRGPCRTVISIGEGVGGAVLTIRASGGHSRGFAPIGSSRALYKSAAWRDGRACWRARSGYVANSRKPTQTDDFDVGRVSFRHSR